MSRFRIRLLCEAGPDPVSGEQLEREEEVVEVEAETALRARARAPLVMTMNPRGRRLRFYDETTGEEIVHEPAERRYRRGTFSLDSNTERFAGWTAGDLWNGWATPCFEREVAERVAADFVRSHRSSSDGEADSVRYDEEGDHFVLYDPYWGEEIEYEGFAIATGEGEVRVYGIGAYEWTWEEVPSA